MVAFCTGSSCCWHAWLCDRATRRTSRSSCLRHELTVLQRRNNRPGGALVPADEGSEPSGHDIDAANAVLTSRGLDGVGVWQRLVNVLKPHLPKFFRFTNYSTLPGRIDFADLAAGEGDGPGRSGLQAARALLELAGTDLDQLQNDDYELRRGELEAVQIDLTNQVFEYWGPARIRGIEGCWHRLAGHVIRMPRAAKLSGLVKPWAVRRSTCSRLLVPSILPLCPGSRNVAHFNLR